MTRGRILLRSLAIALCTLPILWLVIAVTLDQVLSDTAPEAVEAWGWSSAAVDAEIAGRALAAQPSRDDLIEARGRAERALQRDATNVVAARNLGLIDAALGDLPASDRLMNYAESLSRRDLPTEMWQIERNVQRNDIAGALRHYDIALRTSDAARGILLPILARAGNDAGITGPLSDMIAARPPWWQDFVVLFVRESRSPPSIRQMVSRLALDPRKASERSLLGSAMSRLIEQRDYAGAFLLYRRGAPTVLPLVQDGDFRDGTAIPPIGWQLSNEPGLSAEVRVAPVQDGRPALFLSAQDGRGGVVARQLVMLPAASYTLSLTAGSVAGDSVSRPNVTISCAEGVQAGIGLLQATLPVSPASGSPWSGDFSVPSQGCAAQWLEIAARSTLDANAEDPWVTSIRIALRR